MAAAARGIAVRDGIAVEAITAKSGGVVLQTGAGPVRARCVVGCDGVGSLVRRDLDAGCAADGVVGGRFAADGLRSRPVRAVRAQVVEVDTPPVPGDRPRGLLHFDSSDHRYDGYAWDFPTVVGGEALVCRGVYRLQGGRAPVTDLAALLAARLRAIGVDPATCKNKRYAERGFDPAAVLARGPCMVAGEAAGIDGLTGEGIAQAIEYGVLAGRFIGERLRSEPGPGALALDGWNRAVARSRLALDLRIRRAFLRLYQGPRRADLERFLFDCPEGLAIGAAHFAGLPPDWAAVAEVIGRGAARAAAIAMRAVFA
jgi:flavin-dependent dehydrogenase